MTNPNKLADALATLRAAAMRDDGVTRREQRVALSIIEQALTDHAASLADPPAQGDVWRCSHCGELADEMSPSWRWAGDRWQHHHANSGHVDARSFGSPRQPAPAPVQVDDVTACDCGGDQECPYCAGSGYLDAVGNPADPPAPATDGAGEHVATLEHILKHHYDYQDTFSMERAALRAAIAALRQPVPDAVRELPGEWRQLADDNRHYAAQDNEIGRHDSAFALHKGADALETRAAELESALASQQESRNG